MIVAGIVANEEHLEILEDERDPVGTVEVQVVQGILRDSWDALLGDDVLVDLVQLHYLLQTVASVVALCKLQTQILVLLGAFELGL